MIIKLDLYFQELHSWIQVYNAPDTPESFFYVFSNIHYALRKKIGSKLGNREKDYEYGTNIWLQNEKKNLISKIEY